MSDLFAAAAERNPAFQPLAERMRPGSLDEVVGLGDILGSGRALRVLIERGEVPSMILWGPPGSGKTTLARLLSHRLAADFHQLSAVMAGVRELREVVQKAEDARNYHRRQTVLFIDEIHRFNKAQQDALLPHVESGLMTLIGATTENPSFEVNAALLSRCRVFVLKGLAPSDVVLVLQRALTDPRGFGGKLSAPDDVLFTIANSADGDARRALTTLEVAYNLAAGAPLTVALVEEAAQRKTLLYDRAGDAHYGVVSAFIKSMRGSDPDAALYWMARMLEAGEDPRFVLRRMVIFASEDIGNADPQALQVAVNALQSFELMGLPEGVLPMTQAATYLACAPKSTSVITAYARAKADVERHGALPVPKKLRQAPTGLMRGLGFGKDYQYPHDHPGHHVAESYLPEPLAGQRYYEPSDQGHEQVLAARLARLRMPKP